MSVLLYWFVPTASLAAVAGLFMVRMWRKSISSFVSITGLALISNLMYFGYINEGLVAIPILITLLFVRGMVKPENDVLFELPYDGEERRNAK